MIQAKFFEDRLENTAALMQGTSESIFIISFDFPNFYPVAYLHKSANVNSMYAE